MRFLTRVLLLFPPAQRRRLVALQAYFVLAAVIQVLGAVSIVPFIAVISNPTVIRTNALVRMLYEQIGASTEREFMIALGWMLIGMIIVSNTIMAASQWLSVRFATRLGVQLQRELLRGYLQRDFEQLSRENSSRLIARATNGVSNAVNNVVQPLLALNAAICVAALIVGGLLWYNARVALVATALVGGGYYIIFVQLRRRLQHHGRVAWESTKLVQRLLTELFGGAKEIALHGSESRYLDRISTTASTSAASRELTVVLPDMPRFVLEAVVLCALLGLGILLLVRQTPSSDIIGVLTVYAMAGYRLMPAAQTIFRSLSSIRGHAAVIDDVLPDVLEGRAAADRPDAGDAARPLPEGDITFHHVSYSYPNAAQAAIGGATFVVPRRAITALVGKSGAGKSTLADLLLGLLRPSTGDIRIGGTSISDDLVAWRNAMGYVPQSIFLLDDSVAANIAFQTQVLPSQLPRIERAASLAQLDDMLAQLPEGLNHPVGERGAQLSGGQRQRIGIARALYRDADLLVLDEATSALDASTERQIIGALRAVAADKTVVLIAHRASTIRAADHIVLVADGRVVASGSFAHLWETSALFRDLADDPHLEAGL
jgi:ATP-binding cassette, subfamily B, bacterial PglK